MQKPNDLALVDRLRDLFASLDISEVQEKKMFGGTAFMVRGLMCVTARPERIMCRIDPESHDEAVRRKGCSTMEMKGRLYRGYVFVSAEVLKTEGALKAWVEKALAHNRDLVDSKPANAAAKAPAKKRPLKKTKKV